MNALLIKLVTGNFGRIKVLLTAGMMSVVTWLVSWLGFTLGPEDQVIAAGAAALVAAYLLEAFAAALGVKGIKAIQEQIPWVKTDGNAVPGGSTVEAVQLLVHEAIPSVPAVIKESLRAE